VCSRLRRVEHDGGRVGAGGALHQVHVQPLRPHRQLLDRARPEGVGRGQEHGAPLVPQRLRDLRNARGLAGAVDAGDEDDGGRRRGGGEGAIHVGPAHLQARLEKVDGVLAAPHVAGAEALAQIVDDGRGGLDADVGGDEAGLDLVDQVLAEIAPAQQAAQAPAERLPRAAEPLPDRGNG
jgi:hypothetical protein